MPPRAMPPADAPSRLSVLSFNMQVGVGTRRYREYVTRGWRHVLPSQQVRDNLERIGELLVGHESAVFRRRRPTAAPAASR